MARSRRHTAIMGNTTARSEKSDKRLAHRRFRARVREVLHTADDDTAYPTEHEVCDVWDMAKDGKRRFDAHAHPRYMRK